MIEGCEETIVETLYESPQGFRVWYPADLFVVTHEDGNDYFDSNPEYVDAGVSIVEEHMSYDDADKTMAAIIEHTLANNGTVPNEIEEWQLESGIVIKYLDIIWDDEYGSSYHIYANDRVFCVSCYYPVEAAEGIGARIDRMVSTFEWMD